MPASTGPNLGIKYGWPLGETFKTEMDANLKQLDALLHLSVLSRVLATPPGSPAEGDRYIVGAAATGAWATHDNKVALYIGATWVFYVPKAGWRAWVTAGAGESVRYSGSAWAVVTEGGGGGGLTQVVPVAVSDETTALTAGTAKVTFRMPFAFTLTGIRASLTTAQTGGTIFTVDVNEGGTSILSTKLTIDNAEKTSTTAATAAVISDTALADDAEITIDIDQIGDGTAKGLKVYLIGAPA